MLNGVMIDVYNDSGCSSNDSAMPDLLVSIDNGMITKTCNSLVVTKNYCHAQFTSVLTGS